MEQGTVIHAPDLWVPRLFRLATYKLTVELLEVRLDKGTEEISTLIRGIPFLTGYSINFLQASSSVKLVRDFGFWFSSCISN